MTYMETLGDRIRSLRQQNQETQEQLASIAGVTKQAISKIERVGVIESASSTLEPIARHYGVSMRWLLEGGSRDGREAAPLSVSRPVRLDPDIVHGVARAMHEVFEALHYEGSVTDTIAIFAELYDRVSASGITTADVVWLARRVEQGTANEARSNLSNG